MGVKFTEEQLARKGFGTDGKKFNYAEQFHGKFASFPGIFIPGEVRSSKNHREIKRNFKTGKPFLDHTDAVKRYMLNTKGYFEDYQPNFTDLVKDMPLPYHIGFMLIRSTKQPFDYSNIIQLVQDLMQKHKWVPEDNMNDLIPHYLGWRKKPENPGIWIIPLPF